MKWLWLFLITPAFALQADLNGDCRVDMLDLAILASEWMLEDEDCMSRELVLNPNFDGNANRWTLANGWTYGSDAFGNEGAKSGGGTGIGLSQVIDLIEGKLYRLTVHLASAAPFGGVCEISLNVSGVVFSGLITPIPGMDVSVEFTAQEGDTTIQLERISNYVVVESVSVKPLPFVSNFATAMLLKRR